MPSERKKARELNINFKLIAIVAACVIVCFGTCLSVLKWGTWFGNGGHRPAGSIGTENETQTESPASVDLSSFEYLKSAD